MPAALQNALSFVVLLGGLIFIHELGHFVVAKLLKVKVVRFSIGFGPRLFGFVRGETEYRIAALPLGGYVKMAGDDPTEEVAPEDRGRGFLEQAPWKRLVIALAGPVANLVFPGVLILSIYLGQNGSPVPAAVVGAVVSDSPAERAGIRPGDRIVSVTPPGGAPIPVRWSGDVMPLISPNLDRPVLVTVERGGTTLEPLRLVPEATDVSDGFETTRRGVIGLIFGYVPAVVAPARAGVAGPLEPFDLVLSAGGKPVRHLAALDQAVAAAGCAPLDLEVLRERPVAMPGAVLAEYAPVKLAAVPTCDASGARTLVPASAELSTFVAAVVPGSPADRAGLRRGDAITAVNGKRVRTLRELNVLGREFQADRPATLTLRDGRTLAVVTASERFVDETTKETRDRPFVGFSFDSRNPVDPEQLELPQVNLVRPFSEIFSMATGKLADVVRTMVIGLSRIVTGQLSSRNLGGPIMLFQIASQAAEEGLEAFLWMMALVSVNLGLMNLLPIPVLDGGHIVQALVESVTRRPLSLRAREVANVIGLALLVSLMIYVFRNDIMRLMG